MFNKISNFIWQPKSDVELLEEEMMKNYIQEETKDGKEKTDYFNGVYDMIVDLKIIDEFIEPGNVSIKINKNMEARIRLNFKENTIDEKYPYKCEPENFSYLLDENQTKLLKDEKNSQNIIELYSENNLATL
jgi:hypothetical protein